VAVEDADETVSLRRMDRGGCVESGWTDHYSFNFRTPFSRHLTPFHSTKWRKPFLLKKWRPPGYLKWRGGVRKWRGWREWSEWSENGVCKDPPYK